MLEKSDVHKVYKKIKKGTHTTLNGDSYSYI